MLYGAALNALERKFRGKNITASSCSDILAIIPDLASTINLSGNGYSRIKLDVTENELEKVMQLMQHGRERVLFVTIEAAD